MFKCYQSVLPEELGTRKQTRKRKHRNTYTQTQHENRNIQTRMHEHTNTETHTHTQRMRTNQALKYTWLARNFAGAQKDWEGALRPESL